MKVKCKFLDKSESEVEIAENDTIEQVKSSIQKAKDGDAKFAPAVSKLIWKGKILANNVTAKAAGINDKGFFVVMPGKPAPVAASTPVSKPAEVAASSSTETTAASTAVPTRTQPITETPAPTTELAAPAPVAATPERTAPTLPSTQAQSGTPTEMTRQDLINMLASRVQVPDAVLSSIVDIAGVPAEQAKTALLVANGNADHAAELILSGDLEKALQELTREFQNRTSGAQQPAAGQAAAEQWQTTSTEGESGSAGSGGAQAGANPLQYLTQIPAFNTTLNQIRQNPGMLPNFLQQLSQQNPQLFEQLSNHHEEFLALLQDEPAAPAETQPRQAAPPTQPRQGQIELQITQADRESIDTVMAMTQRSELEVVQAYMACEKDMNATINFLYENLD